MTSDELQSIIAAGLPCDHLEVSGDGRHWAAVVVSAAFEGQKFARLIGEPGAPASFADAYFGTNDASLLPVPAEVPRG